MPFLMSVLRGEQVSFRKLWSWRFGQHWIDKTRDARLEGCVHPKELNISSHPLGVDLLPAYLSLA